MHPTLRHVTREGLRQKIESGEAFVLVDALPALSFAASRLPGAINIPPDWVDERAHRRIPDLDTEVVVYCSSATCNASTKVGNRLLELGYRNVGHYAEGKSGWAKAGLPLEGSRA